MSTYTLHARGIPEPVSVDGAPGAGVRETFLEACSLHGIEERDAYSFFGEGETRAGAIEATAITGRDGHEGAECIAEARGLPFLGTDAQVVLAGHFLLPRTTLAMANQENRLSDRARAAFDELIAAGLIDESPADDGYEESRAYSLTDAGLEYPRARSLDWMLAQERFPTAVPIRGQDEEMTP